MACRASRARLSFRDRSFHAFVVVVVVAVFWLLWRLAHAPFGRVLQAVRDNEQRASSLGYNVYFIRLYGLTLTAAVVGLAGALLTFMLQGVYADNLNWQHSGDSLLMTVLGGVHHFLGPLWGAIAFIVLQDRLSSISLWNIGENWWLIFAPILMVFALFSPEGVQGLVQRLIRRERWTLTRNTIPATPASIAPYRTAGAKDGPGRADSRDAQTLEELRPPDHRARNRPASQALRASFDHRPERGRQDDVLQHAVGRAARRRRQVIFAGADISTAVARARPARHRSLVPDPARSSPT